MDVHAHEMLRMMEGKSYTTESLQNSISNPSDST